MEGGTTGISANDIISFSGDLVISPAIVNLIALLKLNRILIQNIQLLQVEEAEQSFRRIY